MTEVSFDVSKQDAELIDQIAFKAVRQAKKVGVELDMTEIQMDLCAVCANQERLDLDKLLSFDDFNLAHDIVGINNHIDRSTGKLDPTFVPRCGFDRRVVKIICEN